MPGGFMNHHHCDTNMTDNNDYDHDLIEKLVRKDKDDENNSFCRDGKGNNGDCDHENNSDNDKYDERIPMI